VVKSLGFDSVNLCVALFRSYVGLAAENLFLRKQIVRNREFRFCFEAIVAHAFGIVTIVITD
jgi:hypothetical protein